MIYYVLQEVKLGYVTSSSTKMSQLVSGLFSFLFSTITLFSKLKRHHLTMTKMSDELLQQNVVEPMK